MLDVEFSLATPHAIFVSSSSVRPSGNTSPRRNKSNIVSRLIAPACQADTTAVNSSLDIPFVLKSEFNSIKTRSSSNLCHDKTRGGEKRQRAGALHDAHATYGPSGNACASSAPVLFFMIIRFP